METERIAGQPSWKIASDRVEAWLTELGGHLGPINFHLGDRTISPYSVAPWVEEPLDASFPPVLRVLRGDFFCMPFGGNDTPFGGEQHPPHGETANARWKLESVEEDTDGIHLHASLRTETRPGRVDKRVMLRRGQTVVYQRHDIAEMAGPMSFGHHAMLRFPDHRGSGLISTSPFVLGRTAPFPVELPENQGYSALKPDVSFDALHAVPTITGERANLSHYPDRRGFEDLVLLVSDASLPLAWTAVSFPSEGFVWFALKNPRILKQTVFWISNMGRYYAPWNGRHVNVMGLEEVTSYFHYGLADSASDNPLSQNGHGTCFQLQPNETLSVPYIMGIAPTSSDFGRVGDILPVGGGEAVALLDEGGRRVQVEVEVGFLDQGELN